MKVRKAEYAGACYGVQRALDLAYAAAQEGESAHTLGALIHNPLVVSELAERGVALAESLDQIEGGTVIIRSHGVVPQVLRDAQAKGLAIVDATCPHVARAQRAAAKLATDGYSVLVVGEAGHPEVEGIVAYAQEAGGSCTVVASPDDIPDQFADPVGVVVQTTQLAETLEAVIETLRARGIDPVVRNTICSATSERQASAEALAREVDAMVVIGGRNSSNTSRLYGICARVCPRAYHIESPDELDPSWFEGCETVGVSAGASTPQSHIDATVAALEAL